MRMPSPVFEIFVSQCQILCGWIPDFSCILAQWRDFADRFFFLRCNFDDL